jgi:thiosulfate dehydrogenase
MNPRTLTFGLALAVACDGAPRAPAASPRTTTPAVRAVPAAYAPPAEAAIPAGAGGASIRRGLALVLHTPDSLPRHAPSTLRCTSCHLDAGRRPGAATLVGVRARFPKFMERTGAVISIQERVNYCFTRSLAGTALPVDGREMADIVAYLDFLSTGLPARTHVRDEGLAPMPVLLGDTARGGTIFAGTCAACHGAGGAGSPPAVPALWGRGSYSIGASMAREERAASFIRRFMPLSRPGSLTDQQAYDVAAYVNAHPRPDSPGKERDWPAGGAPYDVPYATTGHVAHRPPARLEPRRTPHGAGVANGQAQ